MANEGTFKSMKDEISSALVDVTRASGKIAAEDLAFHRSINPSVAPQLAKQNSRLLHLVRDLTKNATVGTDIQPPRLPDVDAIEERWQGLVDVFDSLLEKADACLDEYTGVIKKSNGPQETAPAKHILSSRTSYAAKNFASSNIAKPQLLFEKVPRNDEDTPFKPLLRSKPHAIEPLNESIRLEAVESALDQYDYHFYLSRQNFAKVIKDLVDTLIRYGHPYDTEIKDLRYPDFLYQSSPPTAFLSLDSSKATFVDSLEGVSQMLEELKAAKEIAVDLEHHDTHSYIGLTSLMQISTRDKDWIVDTLKPWREELQVLNEVFADPKILKVFHGAYMDIIWLQRDLGLYVVGLFDTFHASSALGYPKNSLAALLSRYANFDAAKQYQMADWRIRPIPEEMLKYARADTHFLLYIYDNLRNELLEKSDASGPDGNLIDHVLSKSKEVALQRYERPFYDARRGMGSGGWFNFLTYSPALFNREQFAVFRAVHQWRDTVARKEDEGVNQIMSKHVIFNIAREMPIEMAALLGCSHPISAFVRERVNELLQVIRQARKEGATGPDFKETMQALSADRLETVKAAFPPSANTALVAAEQVLPPALPSSITMPSRATNSLFWGRTIDQSLRLNNTPSEPLLLALPLPQLTAEIYATTDIGPSNDAEPGRANPGAVAEHAYVKDRKAKEDDVFIIKNLGGPKKRKASSLEEPLEPLLRNAAEDGLQDEHEPTETSLNDEEAPIARDKAAHRAERKAHKKAERKAHRKAEKQRRKLESKQGTNGDAKMKDEEPFDYENAPSVLHARRDGNSATGVDKVFDPYKKSLDAPTGMGRAQKERAGRSFTFKS